MYSDPGTGLRAGCWDYSNRVSSSQLPYDRHFNLISKQVCGRQNKWGQKGNQARSVEMVWAHAEAELYPPCTLL